MSARPAPPCRLASAGMSSPADQRCRRATRRRPRSSRSRTPRRGMPNRAQEVGIGVEHRAHPMPGGIGRRRCLLEDLDRGRVQDQHRHLLGDDGRPEAARGEPAARVERVCAGEERGDDAVAHRVDVEQRQRREHAICAGQLERGGHRGRQAAEVVVGLRTELRQAGSAGRVHVGGDVEAFGREAGQAVWGRATGTARASDLLGAQHDVGGERSEHALDQLVGVGGVHQGDRGASEQAGEPGDDVVGRGGRDEGDRAVPGGGRRPAVGLPDRRRVRPRRRVRAGPRRCRPGVRAGRSPGRRWPWRVGHETRPFTSIAASTAASASERGPQRGRSGGPRREVGHASPSWPGSGCVARCSCA